MTHPLFLIFLSQFCASLGMNLVNPILPLYASSFDISYTMVGVVMASLGISRIFAEIPGGILTDRVGRKPIIVIGYALSTASHFIAGFAQTPIDLMISRMLIGVGSALLLTASITFVTEIATKENSARYLALYQSTFSIAGILGPTLGGVISDRVGVREIFFISAVTSTIGFLIVLFVKTPPNLAKSEGTRSRSSLTIREVFNIRMITLSASCFLLFFLFNSIRGTMIPLYGADELKLTSIQIGLIFSFTSTIIVLGLLFITHRLERFIRRPLLLPTSLLICSSAVLLISFASDFISLLIFSIPLGFGFSILQPISFVLISDHAKQESRGLTIGVSRTIGGFGIIAGPIMVGWLIDLGQPLLVFYVVTGILSVFSLIAYVIFRKSP